MHVLSHNFNGAFVPRLDRIDGLSVIKISVLATPCERFFTSANTSDSDGLATG